jgi:hypothetical protein
MLNWTVTTTYHGGGDVVHTFFSADTALAFEAKAIATGLYRSVRIDATD